MMKLTKKDKNFAKCLSLKKNSKNGFKDNK